MRIAVIIFLLLSAGVIACSPSAYCLDSNDSRQTKTVEGNLVDIDWVAQEIVVRWLQSEGQVRYDEVTLFVPDNTKITRGADAISLSDLNITDPVTVEYSSDPSSRLKAISINVDS